MTFVQLLSDIRMISREKNVTFSQIIYRLSESTSFDQRPLALFLTSAQVV